MFEGIKFSILNSTELYSHYRNSKKIQAVYSNLIKIFLENFLIFQVYFCLKFQVKKYFKDLLMQLSKLKIFFFYYMPFLVFFNLTRRKESLKSQMLDLQMY